MPEDGIDKFISESEKRGKILGEGSQPKPRIGVDLVRTVKEVKEQNLPVLELANLKKDDIITLRTVQGEEVQQQSFLVSKTTIKSNLYTPHSSQREGQTLELTPLEGNVVPSELKGRTIFFRSSSFGGSAYRAGALLQGTLMEYVAESPDGLVTYFSPAIQSFEIKRKMTDGKYRNITLTELNKLEPADNLERYEKMKKVFDDVVNYFQEVPKGEDYHSYQASDGKNMITVLKTNKGTPLIKIYEKTSKGWIDYTIHKTRGSHQGEFYYDVRVEDRVSPPPDVEKQENRSIIRNYQISNGSKYEPLAVHLTKHNVKSINRIDPNIYAVDIRIGHDGDISITGESLDEKEATDKANQHVSARIENGQLNINCAGERIAFPATLDIEAIHNTFQKAVKPNKPKRGFGPLKF